MSNPKYTQKVVRVYEDGSAECIVTVDPHEFGFVVEMASLHSMTLHGYLQEIFAQAIAEQRSLRMAGKL